MKMTSRAVTGEIAQKVADAFPNLSTTEQRIALGLYRLLAEEGFVLSQLDGEVSVSDLLSLSTLDRVQTLEIIARLLREGIVE